MCHVSQCLYIYLTVSIRAYLESKKLLHIPEDIISKILFGHKVHGLQNGNNSFLLAAIDVGYGLLHILSGASGFDSSAMIDGCCVLSKRVFLEFVTTSREGVVLRVNTVGAVHIVAFVVHK